MFVNHHRVLGTKPAEPSLQHQDRSFKFMISLYLLHNNDPKRLSAIERLLAII